MIGLTVELVRSKEFFLMDVQSRKYNKIVFKRLKRMMNVSDAVLDGDVMKALNQIMDVHGQYLGHRAEHEVKGRTYGEESVIFGLVVKAVLSDLSAKAINAGYSDYLIDELERIAELERDEITALGDLFLAENKEWIESLMGEPIESLLWSKDAKMREANLDDRAAMLFYAMSISCANVASQLYPDKELKGFCR